MHHIAILTENQDTGKQLALWTKCFCEKQGLFPLVKQYHDPELFYTALKKEKPSSVILSLPGVAGLNATERLRSLCPNCGLIWCSDLDFSLHAFRLRVDYFFQAPPTDAELCNGLSLLMQSDRRKSREVQR